MNTKKVVGYVMAGALSLGVLGGASVSAFAAETSTASSTTTAGYLCDREALLFC